jgi:hypothetical protein
MSDKQLIKEWQDKVRDSFGDEAKLYEYLFQTMDNFYYRYLETTTDKDLKTTSFGPHLWGARSTEGSMVDALKITNPEAKKGIIELAKAVPKAQGPKVNYELTCNVQELTPDHGVIKFEAKINWGFPDFNDSSKKFQKNVVFKYEDLAQFRKELALKLEEVCSIFL